MVFLRPATAHLPFDHPFIDPFTQNAIYIWIRMAWIRIYRQPRGSAGCSEQPASGSTGKVRTPDNHPGHQQHENHAHIDQNIIFCPALYLPTSATLCHCLSILRQCSTATEYLSYPDVVMHKTHKHKHQRDENRNAKNGCKMRPICGVPKVCVSH